MEICIEVDDQFIQSLQVSLRMKTLGIAQSAFTLLHWAASEASKGRAILSSDGQGNNIHRLAMPTLDAVKVTSAGRGQRGQRMPSW